MERFLLILSFMFLFQVSNAQTTDSKLEKKVSNLFKDLDGVYGVYIKNLRTGKTVSINADTLFPTASMIKIPILIGIMDRMHKGELQYDSLLTYRDSLLYPGEDILGSFQDSARVYLSKVLMLMLTTSDNTASLWLQSLAGTGTRINEILNSLGFTSTRVNSRTPGREPNREEYGWGQTTPREMATLLEKIYQGEIISPESSVKMIRLLGRNYWDNVGLSQLPPTIFVASKNGAVDESRSETLLVMAPHGPYVYSITTKNLKDTTWEKNNQAWVLTRRLSKMLWEYFEPKSKWLSPVTMEGEEKL